MYEQIWLENRGCVFWESLIDHKFDGQVSTYDGMFCVLFFQSFSTITLIYGKTAVLPKMI